MKAAPKTDLPMALDPFFHPRSIAVVGVSKNPAGVGSSMVRALQRFGYEGKIYPVNPKMEELMGLPVYASISAIPDTVDFARIYVPTGAAFDVVAECKRKGVGAVEVFTAGFSETGTQRGREMEAALAKLAGPDMRIIGPNCFGVYSPEGKVTQIPGENYPQEPGALGFLSQSGGLSEDVFRYAPDFGLRFSKGVSYGNGCDINETDLLAYFVEDPATRIVGAYLEGVKNSNGFIETLRRLSARKPTVIWKGGLTPVGAKMAASHTGSMAGSEKIWKGIFRQTGAVQVDGLEAFMDTVSAFYHLPAQSDPRVALVSGGGGSGVVFSDACYRQGLTLAELDKSVQAAIAENLAPLGTSPKNPVDVGPPFPPEKALEKILDILAASGQVGTIVLDKVSPSVQLRRLMGYTDQMPWEDSEALSEIPVKITKKYGLPVIVILREGGDREGSLGVEAERRKLKAYYLENGVGVFPTAERALSALGRLIEYYRNREMQ